MDSKNEGRRLERVSKVVSDQVYIKTSTEFVDVILSRLTDSNREYEEKLEGFAEGIVRLGWPLSFVTSGLSTLGRIVFEGISNDESITPDERLEVFSVYHNWMEPMLNEIIDAYTSTWERTVSLQKIALQELSTPLIPVFEKISVLPLVGTIDTERAKLIMENLLSGVVKHRADVVLD